MSLSYTGIGSRETPEEFCELFQKIAAKLAISGYILRSGHAKGADQAFERGCDFAGGAKEIYLPWKGFEGSDSDLYRVGTEAYEIAKTYHPSWDRLSAGAMKLIARNGYQVLGKYLSTKSKFILCYTKGGRGDGGTGQAIRIGRAYAIPILDVGRYSSKQDESVLEDFVGGYLR
jgi:hypothetical protein